MYIPEQATLETMTVQDGASTTKVSPTRIDYELQREAIGFLLVVPAGHTVVVTVNYGGPFVDATVSPQHDTLDWTKEIGAPAWPISLMVNSGKQRRQVAGDLGSDRMIDVVAP